MPRLSDASISGGGRARVKQRQAAVHEAHEKAPSQWPRACVYANSHVSSRHCGSVGTRAAGSEPAAGSAGLMLLGAGCWFSTVFGSAGMPAGDS